MYDSYTSDAFAFLGVGKLTVIMARQLRTTKLMRFTRCRSFGLRQIAAKILPRLRISKTLYDMSC
jgi:hypothetical protein